VPAYDVVLMKVTGQVCPSKVRSLSVTLSWPSSALGRYGGESSVIKRRPTFNRASILAKLVPTHFHLVGERLFLFDGGVLLLRVSVH
jgi:hypothetical protein